MGANTFFRLAGRLARADRAVAVRRFLRHCLLRLRQASVVSRAWLARAGRAAERFLDAWIGESSHPLLPAATIVPDAPEAYCGRCGSLLPPVLREREGMLIGGETAACSACRGRKQIADRIIRVGEHAGTLRRRVLALKHDPADWRNARVLGDAIGRVVAAAIAGRHSAAIIVPVPMPRRRRLARGVDHTRILADGIVGIAGGEVCRPFTRRYGPRQAGFSTVHQRMTRGGRGLVLRGSAQRWRERLRGRLVIVVDDVLTTGTTARRLVRRLRRFGPDEIWVAVLTVRSWNRVRFSEPLCAEREKKC